MSGWLVIALLCGGPALVVVIVYAAERDLRRREERARQALAWLQSRRRDGDR